MVNEVLSVARNEVSVLGNQPSRAMATETQIDELLIISSILESTAGGSFKGG